MTRKRTRKPHRVQFHVTPRAKPRHWKNSGNSKLWKGWQVRREGVVLPGSFARQREAVKAARALAQLEVFAQVWIHARTGRVRRDITIGGDPYPPKG